MEDSIKNILITLLYDFTNSKINSDYCISKIEELFDIQNNNNLDFVYCVAILNTQGINALSDKLNRLKSIDKRPCDMIKVKNSLK